MALQGDALPIRVYRAMRKDDAGRPRTGIEGNMLGVRPGTDIFPDATGNVSRGHGGLSVTPDDPIRLPPHVRPIHLGGKGKLPVFEIVVMSIESSLSYRGDDKHPGRHGFIEPAVSMTLDAYQALLAATQEHWKEIT